MAQINYGASLAEILAENQYLLWRSNADEDNMSWERWHEMKAKGEDEEAERLYELAVEKGVISEWTSHEEDRR